MLFLEVIYYSFILLFIPLCYYSCCCCWCCCYPTYILLLYRVFYSTLRYIVTLEDCLRGVVRCYITLHFVLQNICCCSITLPCWCRCDCCTIVTFCVFCLLLFVVAVTALRYIESFVESFESFVESLNLLFIHWIYSGTSLRLLLHVRAVHLPPYDAVVLHLPTFLCSWRCSRHLPISDRWTVVDVVDDVIVPLFSTIWYCIYTYYTYTLHCCIVALFYTLTSSIVNSSIVFIHCYYIVTFC